MSSELTPTAPPRRIFRKAFAVLGFLLSGWLVIRLAYRFDSALFIDSIRQLSLPWVALAVTIYFLGFLARAARCQTILGNSFSISIPAFLRALFVGCCMNGLLPYRLGEIGRVVYLNVRQNLDSAMAFANLAAERLMDVFTLAFLALTIVIPFMGQSWLKGKQSILIGVFGVSIGIFLWGGWWSRRNSQVQKNSQVTPDSFFSKFWESVQRFSQGLTCFSSARTTFLMFLLSLIAMTLESISYFLLLISMNIHTPFGLAIVLFISIGFTALLPAAPGNLGILQFATIFVLTQGGVPENQALNFSLILTVLLYLPVLSGLIILLTEDTAPLKQAWQGASPSAILSPAKDSFK